ncbi:MAG: hypothetical protein M0D55_12310 [Elusimicrobiota bacterium]|nr:MAG: hypothetical protein M0D55_12310 [Elusimicrobiota bacterium]
MIKRISAVALCASLLLPSPSFAQALRASVQAPVIANYSAANVSSLPQASAFAPSALAPLALTPALASRPAPLQAPAPATAVIIPFPARAQADVIAARLVAAPQAKDVALAAAFDGSVRAANDDAYVASIAPAAARPSLLNRAAAFGNAAVMAAVPAVQHVAGPAAQNASSFPTWAGFAILGASLAGLLFTVRWIEGSKTVQFYLARRRWVTENNKKWKEATDEEKARVEAEADGLVARNKAGRWPGNRKAKADAPAPIEPTVDLDSPTLTTPDGRPYRRRPSDEVPSAPAAAAPAPSITFADVAGQEDAKRELQKVVDYIKNPEPYNKLGAKGFKGVLMFGPPARARP